MVPAKDLHQIAKAPAYYEPKGFHKGAGYLVQNKASQGDSESNGHVAHDAGIGRSATQFWAK